MQFTDYFWFMRQRPDRAFIELQWIERMMESPEREETQSDGRFRLWACGPRLKKWMADTCA